jgi:hypothetical protein
VEQPFYILQDEHEPKRRRPQGIHSANALQRGVAKGSKSVFLALRIAASFRHTAILVLRIAASKYHSAILVLRCAASKCHCGKSPRGSAAPKRQCVDESGGIRAAKRQVGKCYPDVNLKFGIVSGCKHRPVLAMRIQLYHHSENFNTKSNE